MYSETPISNRAASALGVAGLTITVAGVVAALGATTLQAWPLAIALLATSIVLAVGQRRFGPGMRASAGDLPLLGAILLLPVGLAALCGLSFAVVDALVGRSSSKNVSVTTIAAPVLGAALIFAGLKHLFEIQSPRQSMWLWFSAAVLALLFFYLLNPALVAGWSRLRYAVPVRDFLRGSVAPTFAGNPVLALTAACLVEMSLLLHGAARFLPAIVAVMSAVGMALYISSARKRLDALEQKAELSQAIFRMLARLLEMRDPETARHSARVAMYSRDIAMMMGVTGHDQSRVHLAGLLHDVGKVGIPDEVLNKPGPLGSDERRLMESHAWLSAKALMDVPGLGEVARLVYAHQERMNGSGYPEGLIGNGIPLGARIIAVADAFEAMTSDRPYRDAIAPEEAIEALVRDKGLHFDVQAVRALSVLVLGGSADYREGSIADFSLEWARAGELLAVDAEGDQAPDPFVLPRLEDLELVGAFCD